MSTQLEEYSDAFQAEGRIIYEPDWYLLSIPEETHTSLLQLVEAVGVPFKAAARPHISVMKNEVPCLNKGDWGTLFVDEPVRFRYQPVLRGENGLHFWLDCHSPRLCEMREHFGLVTLKRGDGAFLVNFHFTIGRRKKAIEPQHRPQLRLCPQSHIDVATGMQHL